MICMLTLQIYGYNNRGDEDDQRRSSAGRRKPDEGDGALWFVYSTDRDRGVYQDPGAGVSVYAAAFVYDVGGAIAFCTFLNLGSTISINNPITESNINTATPVIALHCQLLFNIFKIAQTAIIGALAII